MLSFLLYFNLVAQVYNGPAPRFQEQIIDSNINIGYGVAIGDVDGDGKPDILLADKKQFVWYRNGDWKKFVMAENLTEFDNVCIAARDINGDGKVEVAVGAQWNPSETSNDKQSGSVHYLVRPTDPTQKWEAVELHHEPTIHRMRWVRSSEGKFYLVVLPLHGRGNKNGEGEGVKVIAYEFPSDVHGEWRMHMLANDMHLTHNLAPKEIPGGNTEIYVAGREGVRLIYEPVIGTSQKLNGKDHAAGEIKTGQHFVATVEPMHGNNVVIYENKNGQRIVLDSNLNEAHALGVADFSGTGSDQVVAGWRAADKEGNTGIKLYSKNGSEWKSQWIDKNGIACEDLQVDDLNGDGKTDIIASGRATRNLKIYWNTSK